MLDIVRIGPFGIFRKEDFLRAVPRTSVGMEARLEHVPKLPMESFRFVLVEKTLIEVALFFKRLEAKTVDIDPDYQEIVDPSNARATDRRITLDEDEIIALFGWDAATYPPRNLAREPASQKLAPERVVAINFRSWIAKIKKFNKAQADSDEAMASLPPTENPDYQELLRKAFAKAPSDEERNEIPTLRLKIENALQTRFEELIADPDFVESLSARWTQNKDTDEQSMTMELLDECLETVFGIVTEVSPKAAPAIAGV